MFRFFFLLFQEAPVVYVTYSCAVPTPLETLVSKRGGYERGATNVSVLR